jgi:hypothetical protein
MIPALIAAPIVDERPDFRSRHLSKIKRALSYPERPQSKPPWPNAAREDALTALQGVGGYTTASVSSLANAPQKGAQFPARRSAERSRALQRSDYRLCLAEVVVLAFE